MSTATLTKSQRKQLRRQMEERKQALLAKHGRSASSGRPAARPSLPKDPPRASYQPPTIVLSPPARPTPRPTKAPAIAKPARPPGAVVRSVEPEIRDLSNPGPGPLTRTAAGVERVARRAAAAWRERPWRERPLRCRAEAHRTLARVVPPLRFMGVAGIIGALALAREARGFGLSDTGVLVVLGMSLGGAVVLLTLAEMARALQVVVLR